MKMRHGEGVWGMGNGVWGRGYGVQEGKEERGSLVGLDCIGLEWIQLNSIELN